MAIQFISVLPSCQFVLKSGKICAFTRGEYVTDNEKEIAEFRDEIEAGHPHLKEGRQVAKDELDPVAHIKAQAIKEYLEKMAASTDPNNDMGTTTQNDTPMQMGVLTSGGVTATAKPAISINKSK